MRALRDAPFPFQTVRDLLGILRMLYAASKRDRAGERRLKAIADIGRELRKSMQLARSYAPGTLGFTAAWERAEAAVLRLGELVDCTTPLEPTLRAAGDRIAHRATRASPRDRKRVASRERS